MSTKNKRSYFSQKKKTKKFRDWRQKEFERLGGKCPLCGREMILPEPGIVVNSFARASVDHITPLDMGGRNAYDNFRLICQFCNGIEDRLRLGQIAPEKDLTAVIKRDTVDIKEKRSMTNSIVEYMNREAVKKNIQETIGDKTAQYIASVASLVNSNASIAECEQKSIMSACLIAASLDLPINQNLGFAFIIPYKKSVKNEKGLVTGYEMIAQFQMGYKGFIQLAMRSGQFKTINVTEVREGEVINNNRLTGEIEFNWLSDDIRGKAPVVGYVAYMQLLNGFSKQLYMTVADLNQHGLRFSQSMKRGYGLWKDDFNSMAMKTVIKLLLSKYAPMTVDMEKAQIADHAAISEGGYQFPDNQPVDAHDVANDTERVRIVKHIESSKTITELEQCELAVNDFPEDAESEGSLVQLFLNKKKSLGGK